MSELEKDISIGELQVRLSQLTERIEKQSIQKQEDQKKEMMNLLHEYNKVKDATQIILGALANIDGVTFKDVHLKYNLPID